MTNVCRLGGWELENMKFYGLDERRALRKTYLEARRNRFVNKKHPLIALEGEKSLEGIW